MTHGRIQRMCCGLLVVGAGLFGGSAAAAVPAYSLSIPGAPKLRLSADVADNAWLASNPVASVSAAFASSTPVQISTNVTPGLPRYRLAAMEAGFSVERIKPEVWLGDQLPVPSGREIDWVATYEAFATNETAQSQFIFDTVNKRVFVQSGGTITFTWIDVAGTQETRAYIASGSASGRPYKMFWTEAPWNSPVIDLSGKFVKLFGPSELVVPEYGTRIKDVGGYQTVESNVVVRGVYLDPSVNSLSVYGQVRGQFILAYYDTGSYSELKSVQVIEVGEPDVNDMTGVIGTAIQPHGSGHSTEGFWPSPVKATTEQEDEFGPYYYQHKGSYSYSPKNNMIFPLRETVDMPWRIDIYWMESDTYGVSWPFERSQYACTWPTNDMPVLIAGDDMQIPSDYTAELVKYQVPNGHARAPENNVFTTSADGFATATAVGYSCLKLTTLDNVWFLPLRTVARTNPDFFTLEPEPWTVGDELVPRGGSVAGTAAGYQPAIDTSVSGVIDESFSGRNYNPELYYNWMTASNDLPSVIYAVNASEGEEPIEVHWFTSVQKEDMPAKVAVPCLPQRYRISYPETDESLQIVLASQLGSAGESRPHEGQALYFDSPATTATLPSALYFRADEATLSFTANAESLRVSDGSLATLADDRRRLRIGLERDGTAVRYRLSARRDGEDVFELTTAALSTSGWHRVTFSLHGTNAWVFADGVRQSAQTIPEMDFSGELVQTLGAAQGTTAPHGLELDDFVLAATAASEEDERTEHLRDPDARDLAVTCCLTFSEDDLEPQFGSNVRWFTDSVTGLRHVVTAALCAAPGAPRRRTGVLQSDVAPRVYRQNDPAGVGYNPNEEHAFVSAGDGGYVVWALRCDLNTEATSRPGVLVEYQRNGRPAMKYFAVVPTNETYAAFAGTATVGTVLPGPHPLDLLENPWLSATYWDRPADGSTSPGFRDRKGQVWSRCAGSLPIHMYYPNQDGFDYPGLATQPALGAAIPWLACLDNPGDDPLTGSPTVWEWTVSWPEQVESMRIGQTLTSAADGLPEVWNARSMAVLYPETNAEETVVLWDPTVIRTAAGTDTVSDDVQTPAALLALFGFDPAKGNVQLRGGKYTFSDLPPAIGDRLFVDATRALASCLCLKGEQATNAGGSILYPNVLSADEVAAIQALVPNDHAWKGAWDRIISTLPHTPLQPSTLSATKEGEAVVSYTAKDHYALTAMGATNYVVLIENDATNETLRVADGDPISLHVFAVAPSYHAGRVVTREDPVNLLSQQLGILYTEAFAGRAGDYEFEWKKAPPLANGAMSTDYENGYARVFDDADAVGKTRFTIGRQGDTLANLVNTYYVMRYRAKAGTVPHRVMGDQWSAWCGPALAEGWLQRCVNNVTPFTQRMTDLYANETETTVSMIAQAGRPWTGDVALNQDNLTEVGLIELYQTLLNKAESMSLALGVNDTEANKQLLLAAERLCDLYVLLGNEAYADALNPTIGFGSDDYLDHYGHLSTSLFCFDNQVPSLLDEELALLRGRTGANNPSVTAAPFYNRLVWNFTRGITAGEVAYAVNYNVNSTNGDASLDEDDAAAMYPQGHGDAWGHYLSAMGVWYRLLRNPSFSWSTSQMQMNVADNVVDVDFFDEERFAETAGKLATTATEIMDRTARKAWRDHGGATGAGYLDDETSRNFGYGEWATRGGIGGVMNWMVANSLLPEAESAQNSYVATLTGDACLCLTNAPVSQADGAWTFECRVARQTSPGNILEMVGDVEDGQVNDATVEGETTSLVLTSGADGVCNLSFGVDVLRVVSVTNVTMAVETNSMEQIPVTSITYELRAEYRPIVDEDLPLPTNALIAVSRTAAGELTVRVLDADGGLAWERVCGEEPLNNPRVVCGGGGFAGVFAELRFWHGPRTREELHAHRAYVNPRDADLIAYARTLVETASSYMLPDLVPGGRCPWEFQSPQWQAVAESGLSVAFDDEGLLRINRATATDLAVIPTAVDAVQRKLDQLDAGMNPLGLSDSAVPMDISSEGVAEGTSTHFEQIAARAEKALANATHVLDRAQTAARHLRLTEHLQATEQEEAQISEADYVNQLIDIYGTPYSDDIGPSGTYPQGYTGPDLYHYMYMDLSLFGVSGADNLEPVSVVTYDGRDWTYQSMKEYMESADSSSPAHATSQKFVYQLSANGLVLKPASFTGTRRAAGKIQDAYTAYILAWVDYRNNLDTYLGRLGRLSDIIGQIDSLRGANEAAYDAAVALHVVRQFAIPLIGTAEVLKGNLELGAILADDSEDYADALAGKGTIGAGLTAVFNPMSLVYGAAGVGAFSAKAALNAAAKIAEDVITVEKMAVDIVEAVKMIEDEKAAWTSAQKAAVDEARAAILDLSGTVQSLKAAWAAMVAEAENFDTIVAEGDRIQAAREAARARRANRTIRRRYNDMFFRQTQNEALSRYAQAFDLARKYVYLAAQTYDYETGLLTADPASGAAFRAEIVGACTLGELTDIRERMQTNYGVLKGRLGLNNPDRNATWFSLRRELFRLAGDASGEEDWRLALAKCRVDDLRTVPEFLRHCQPIATTGKEPALVIPFASTIDFAKNFFGNDLAAGDHALDSSYFATKIASAGVRLEGYPSAALGATPSVYLVPVGLDMMRQPGRVDVSQWQVVDQVIPVPYAIGSTQLDDPDWQPLYSLYTGGTDAQAKIRRFPSFRAMTGDADDADRANTRLIGRSAWNTRWVLIIPAGALLGGTAEDRARALTILIDGLDSDRDGVVDVPGIRDIQIGLRTYSMSGN